MVTKMENNIDFQVDETLEKCILSTPRKSFFLFAGAGSGKTYSLVLLLKKFMPASAIQDLEMAVLEDLPHALWTLFQHWITRLTVTLCFTKQDFSAKR
jgi:hypothetical protein